MFENQKKHQHERGAVDIDLDSIFRVPENLLVRFRVNFQKFRKLDMKEETLKPSLIKGKSLREGRVENEYCSQ